MPHKCDVFVTISKHYFLNALNKTLVFSKFPTKRYMHNTV